jgi:hypothetical protein
LREGEGRRYHRLGGKVTTIKGEFEQQDDKLYLCIYCLFYIMVMTKKMYEILRVIVVLLDVREPI